MGVKNNLALIFKYFVLNLKKEAQYKTSFALKIIMMIFNDLFFIIQWVIIFELIGDIHGYGFNDVMMLWAVSAGAFGFAKTFFNGAFKITNAIYYGKLDVFLTQPKNVLINISCSSTDVSALGDIIYAILIQIIIGNPWWWIIASIPVMIMSALLYVGVYVTMSSLAFYIKKGDALASIVESVVLKTDKYPLAIFNNVIKILLYTVFPAAFLTVIPSEMFLFGFNIWWFLIYFAVVVVWILLAFFTFNRGLRNYNSGNLMSGRL